MSNTYNSVATPQNAILGHASLAAVTACPTRAPVLTANLGTTNLILCVPIVSPAADCKITKISIKGISNNIIAATAAQLIGIWDYDGTTAWLVAEIPITLVTPSTTVPSFYEERVYDDFVLPSGHALYVSTTITTTASTTALGVTAHGASF